MCNDFLTDFLRKIFAVSCVLCKGLYTFIKGQTLIGSASIERVSFPLDLPWLLTVTRLLMSHACDV